MTGDQLGVSLFELGEAQLRRLRSSCVETGTQRGHAVSAGLSDSRAARLTVHSLSASLNLICAPTLATFALRKASTSIRRCSLSTMAICLWVRCSSSSASRWFT